MYKLLDLSILHDLIEFDLGDVKAKAGDALISQFEGDSSKFEIYDETTAIKEALSVIHLNNTEEADFFTGEEKAGFLPGRIDLNYTFFIGQTGYSEPIALYFKNNLSDPEVIHLVVRDDVDVWIQIFPTYRDILKFITH